MTGDMRAREGRQRARLLSAAVDMGAELLAGEENLPGYYHPSLRGRGRDAYAQLRPEVAAELDAGDFEALLDERLTDADRRAAEQVQPPQPLVGGKYRSELLGSDGLSFVEYGPFKSAHTSATKHIGHIRVEHALRGRCIGTRLLMAAVSHLGEGGWIPFPVKAAGEPLFERAAVLWPDSSNRWTST